MVLKQQPCDVENTDDFSRYYRGSFLPYRDGIVSVIGANPGAVEVYTAPNSPESSRIPWEQFKKESSFGVPSLGTRNIGPTMGFIYMSPTRQSNRGYIGSLCGVKIFNTWENRHHVFPNLMSWDVAKEVYFPRFYSLNEALDELEQGRRIGCAISPNVGLFTSRNFASPVLSYKKDICGYMQGREVHILPKFERVLKSVATALKAGVYVIAHKGGHQRKYA